MDISDICFFLQKQGLIYDLDYLFLHGGIQIWYKNSKENTKVYDIIKVFKIQWYIGSVPALMYRNCVNCAVQKATKSILRKKMGNDILFTI